MPEGGTLSISAKNFKVTEADIHHYPSAKAGSYIVILVSDTGTGIEPEIIDKIFEPFFTTKESNKGTGLGLSTVISIVRNFGGFIEINSEVGQGTQFSIYLPTGEVSPPALQNSGSTELLIGHGEMILIVDDEASIREITKTSLETYAYNVLTASTGMQALSIYQEHREAISIVMVDLLMPLMDGKILIQQLKSINPTVKVILISGSEPTNIPGEIRENIKAFLFKPYIMKDLLKVLNEALNHP